MGKIQLLDSETINQIAAGEVIDRPASVVKELMENAIDAGATIISVEIKDGGTSEIRISDNGSGIEKEDIKTAFLRHSTSKIRNALDLLSVSSLGFRGEALSSIAAVCQVTLITKTEDELTGSRYVIEGGREVVFEQVGSATGTTFIIKNIFFNTPARRKFLKTAQTEAGYVADVVEHIALSHPEISIRFISNRQARMHTPGNGSLKDVIYNIYGKDTAENVVEIDKSCEFMSIRGFIGRPVINRGNRNGQNYFINGRYVRNAAITKAIDEAYKPYLMQHRYPFTVLHIETDPELLDVNVHPSKMELRFRNTDRIMPFIIDAIGGALREKPVIPDVKLVEEEKTKAIINRKEEKQAEPFEINRISKTEKVDYSVVQNNEKTAAVSENVVYDSEYGNLFDEGFLSVQAREKHKIIGQVFDTYWIVEYTDKMFIIDQHAAHEKVLFESLMERLKTRTIESQNLNPPIIISLTMREEQLLKTHMEAFREVGFEIEPFGGQEFAVRAVPMDLYALNDRELLMDIIDGLDSDSSKINSELLTDRIATMSCKAAVKGSNRLSVAEANELIDKLLKLDNPYNCPHGRPTIISMSRYEIERKFKRIL